MLQEGDGMEGIMVDGMVVEMGIIVGMLDLRTLGLEDIMVVLVKPGICQK